MKKIMKEIGAIIGIILAIILVGLFIITVTSNDDANNLMKRYNYAKSKCEYTISRNQVCKVELVATPVPVGEEQ